VSRLSDLDEMVQGVRDLCLACTHSIWGRGSGSGPESCPPPFTMRPLLWKRPSSHSRKWEDGGHRGRLISRSMQWT
jgi:hypothetical protein